jgi:hypothetical protein
MKFHPIKYRQPVVGDSRCALYSIANLLGDNGILLFTDVGKMTNAISESQYLLEYNNVLRSFFEFDREPDKIETIKHIHPVAIVPGSLRITGDPFFFGLKPDSETGYFMVLIDHLAGAVEHAHTVGVLWGNGGKCIVIDPQKNAPVEVDQTDIFEKLHVVGYRVLNAGETEKGHVIVPEFEPEELPHIFADVCLHCQPCPLIPGDVLERETNAIRLFCTQRGIYTYPTDSGIEDTFESVPHRIEYRNIRHEVTFQQAND